MHELSDASLIESTLAGNGDAFGVLFERYLSMAQNIAQGIVHDRAVAEDLAQDAMLQAYLSLGNLEEPARYASWLHGIVRNLSHSYLRRQSRTAHIEERDSDDWQVVDASLCSFTRTGRDPVRALVRKTQQESVRMAIERLAPKRRSAAALFYLEQMSVREIARATNASETAIKSRLHQARKQLQIQLAPLYIDLNRWHENKLANERPVKIERVHTMIKIDSVHVLQIDDLEHTIICFLAQEQKRYLQIWVDTEFGRTLQIILNGDKTDRPITHNTMYQMLALVDAGVESVEVSALKDKTFYAVININSNGSTKQLDARPSDAVTLALIAEAPIYVANDVIEQAGSELPSPFDQNEWLDAVKTKHEEHARWIARWRESLSTGTSTFTVRARQVCLQMVAEAGDFGHNYIGTEHLLLSLAATTQGVAAKVLSDSGISEGALRDLMGRHVGRAESSRTADPIIAPRVAQVFELAEVERAKMGHTYVGTEHLLLGLIAEGESATSDQKGMAIQFMKELGLNTSEVRQEVLSVIGQN